MVILTTHHELGIDSTCVRQVVLSPVS